MINRFVICVQVLICLMAGTVAITEPAGVQMLDVSRAAFDGWRVMPVRSEEEYRMGRPGGESEQHNHGIARSLSNPEIIYLSHDCGQIWRSMDAGE